MIKEVCFLALKDKLFETTHVFKKAVDSEQSCFHSCDDFQEFNMGIDQLYYEFVSELRVNICFLKTRSEINIYLAMLLHVFEMLKDHLEVVRDLQLHFSEINLASKDRVSFNTGLNGVVDAMTYTEHQLGIIQKSLELINELKQCYSCEHNISELKLNSWQEDFQEYYPVFMRIKHELVNFVSLKDKIDYLQKFRKQIVDNYCMRGVNFIDSPLNIYFEVLIDSLKDLSSSSVKVTNKCVKMLMWAGTKTDFLELMLALDLAKVIKDDKSNSITRKELIKRFEVFFNIEPIPDPESRINKLKHRASSTSFFDSLYMRLKCNIAISLTKFK